MTVCSRTYTSGKMTFIFKLSEILKPIPLKQYTGSMKKVLKNKKTVKKICEHTTLSRL